MTTVVDVIAEPETWPVEVLAEPLIPGVGGQGGGWRGLQVPTISVAVLLSRGGNTVPFPDQTVRLRAQFLRRTAASGDSGGYSSDPFNPYGLSVKIKTPSGSVDDITSDVVSASTGHYYVDYEPSESGMHHIRWAGHDGSGGPLGVAEAPIQIQSSDVI